MPLSRSLVVPLLAIVAVGCSASYPTDPTDPAGVDEVRLLWEAPASPTPNTSLLLVPYALNEDLVWRSLRFQGTWSSSNPSVVRADATTVYPVAVGPGVAVIGFTSGGKTGSLPVTVDPPVAYPRLELAVNPPLPGSINFTGQASAYFREVQFGPTRDVTAATSWTSSDPTVVTVGQAGALQATGLPGNVELRATWGSYTARYLFAIQPR